MELPRLKERLGDIPELVHHFLTTRQIGPHPFQAAPEVLEALLRYDWPGNVRELANVLERAQILAENHTITLDDLPDNLVGFHPEPVDQSAVTNSLQQAQKRHVQAVLREHGGNKVHAARALGISRRALYRLLEKYGIRGHEDSASDE